jgi:hypothetical protein
MSLLDLSLLGNNLFAITFRFFYEESIENVAYKWNDTVIVIKYICRHEIPIHFKRILQITSLSSLYG